MIKTLVIKACGAVLVGVPITLVIGLGVGWHEVLVFYAFTGCILLGIAVMVLGMALVGYHE